MNRYAFSADFVHRPVLGVDGYCFERLKRAAELSALDHLSKDGIFTVEMRLLAVRNKELRQSPQRTCERFAFGPPVAIATMPRVWNCISSAHAP